MWCQRGNKPASGVDILDFAVTIAFTPPSGTDNDVTLGGGLFQGRLCRFRGIAIAHSGQNDAFGLIGNSVFDLARIHVAVAVDDFYTR